MQVLGNDKPEGPPDAVIVPTEFDGNGALAGSDVRI